MMPAVRRPETVVTEFTGSGLLTALGRLDAIAAGSPLRPRTWAARRLSRILGDRTRRIPVADGDGGYTVRVALEAHDAGALAHLLGVPPPA